MDKGIIEVYADWESLKKTVSTWRVKARTLGISKREIEKMSGAFFL